LKKRSFNETANNLRDMGSFVVNKLRQKKWATARPPIFVLGKDISLQKDI